MQVQRDCGSGPLKCVPDGMVPQRELGYTVPKSILSILTNDVLHSMGSISIWSQNRVE